MQGKEKFTVLAHRSRMAESPLRTVLVLFGTRPEIIKLAPVIHGLYAKNIRTCVVSSSQHKDLLMPFLEMLDIKVDFDLGVMRNDQGSNEVCSRVLIGIDELICAQDPDMIVVQGDTSTTLAGALAAFNRKVPVAHVEAGLRSGNRDSPFPEEMNRRLVSQIASFHFAATKANRVNLVNEGIPDEQIFVTGNPVVDSLLRIAETLIPSPDIRELLKSTIGSKRILVTTHRRESFGPVLLGNLRVLRDFVRDHADVCLFFPVHPNPNVRQAVGSVLEGVERIHLLDPLNYSDFIALMKASWLIVSDSGGVQEEAPSLGKPLIVLRENTERPEALDAGISKLVGGDAGALEIMLEENYLSDTWTKSVKRIPNPFGDGKAAKRIVDLIETNCQKRVPV